MDQNKPKSFTDLINNPDKPVLVDFYADWCGPCKMLAPVIKRIAGEMKNEIITVKIDTEKNQSVSAAYGIQSIPTIMLFKKGEAVMRLAGAYPYERLVEEIRKHL